MPRNLIDSLAQLGFPSSPLGPLSAATEVARRRSPMRGYFERLDPQSVLFDLDQAGRGFGGKS
jgi:hypothetical protein